MVILQKFRSPLARYEPAMTADASARNGSGASVARKIRVTRRRVVAGAAALAGLSVAATAAYAAAIEPQGLIVTRYAPSLPSWPRAASFPSP